MSEGKYTKIDGAIKTIVGEYCKVGGAIKTGIVNAMKIGGAIKQITLADRYFYTSESVNDELYRVTDAGVEDWHYDLADATVVAVNEDGESYWGVGTDIVKLKADGTLGWTYSGHDALVTSVCVENRSGITYVYSGNYTGGVICLIDGITIAGVIWVVNVDVAYGPPIYALAVDAANDCIYAGASFYAASKGVWQAATDTGTFVKRYASSEDIIALAVDMDGKIYCGDSVGNYRKINNGGYVYWTKTRGGSITGIEIAHNGYGYFTCESEKKVCQFTPATGVTTWEYTPGLSSYAYGCAVDAGGNVYVVYRYLGGSAGNFIYKVDKNGNYVSRWQSYVNVKFYGIAVTPGLEAAGW